MKCTVGGRTDVALTMHLSYAAEWNNSAEKLRQHGILKNWYSHLTLCQAKVWLGLGLRLGLRLGLGLGS